ncbi:hypothetical protein V8G54_016251 [Vigna mungo]|uniref:Uncharacterized protein n=1 Tax=Vigna mungo TaxID=3915 RepID=A0AAQ3NMS1_VIGMU
MAKSNASFLALRPGELSCFLYKTFGINAKTLFRKLLTLDLGIRCKTFKILNPLNTTSSFGIETEKSSNSFSGRCHPYCDLAERSSKKTGMHPASIESNVDRRVGVSPGGCKQKLACSMGRINRTGSCSQTPLEQSTISHNFSYDGSEVAFSHSLRMLRRMLGDEDPPPPPPPPPANNARMERLERRTRVIHDSSSPRLRGWKEVG